MSKKILAIGAHFDDVEMGCGGTLMKHSRIGDNIIVAVTSSDDPFAGDIKVRLAEQKESNKITGFSLMTFKNSDSIESIIGLLDRIEPNILFYMHDKDTHQEHIRAHRVGAAVSRKKSITSYIYDGGSSYEFHPNIFSLIEFAEKERIISCFQTQIERGTIKIDIIKKKEMYWASLVSNNPEAHAEGFLAKKIIYKVGG
ncbi:MAG: PIG-L family deacetylase [Candidatus Thorarchaeota archaeon]|jgi:LmbE family N-acetylglucosaminyl deacetylase